MAERMVVRVVGDDRVSFLHGMCSNDIKNARPGAIVPALFLTEHAHAIAEFFAWIGEDSVLIEIDRDGWTRARAHLEKLLVADDVEFEDQAELSVVDIEGPRAAEAIHSVAKDAAMPDAWRSMCEGELTIGNVPRYGLPAFTILMERTKASAAISAIEALGDDFRQVSHAAMDIVRIENGVAEIGVDTTDKTIALEARLNRDISFDKGCYVGQETIERATARGGLKKKLFGLRFEGNRMPEIHAMLMFDGKEVGRLSSAVLSPRFGAIGLAILHHSAWKPGTRVAVSDSSGEIAATVSDIPFR